MWTPDSFNVRLSLDRCGEVIRGTLGSAFYLAINMTFRAS